MLKRRIAGQCVRSVHVKHVIVRREEGVLIAAELELTI